MFSSYSFSRFAFGLVALVLTLSSCKKVLEDLLTFNLENSANFTVPGYDPLVTLPIIPITPVETNSRQEFSKQGTEVNKVKNIYLTKLRLTATAPADANFGRLESIKLFISGPNLPEKLLAYKENIPTDQGNVLDLETSGERLDDYVKGENYTLRTEARLRSTATSETEVRADMTFKVTANI